MDRDKLDAPVETIANESFPGTIVPNSRSHAARDQDDEATQLQHSDEGDMTVPRDKLPEIRRSKVIENLDTARSERDDCQLLKGQNTSSFQPIAPSQDKKDGESGQYKTPDVQNRNHKVLKETKDDVKGPPEDQERGK